MATRGRMGFERGAPEFEARAGVPDDALAPLPALLDALGCPTDGTWLDVGAGTGQLARALGSWADAYLALDRAEAMLRVLRERVDNPVATLRADADAGWPVSSASLSGVCLFRVAHLLEPVHLARELARCVRPGGHVLWLRRERDPVSARAQLRREMRKRVQAARGTLAPGAGVGAALEGVCGPPAFDGAVSRWQTHTSLRAALDAWGGKEGLAGGPFAAPEKLHLLRDLESWATKTLGDLNALRACEERLVLGLFRLPR